VLEIFLRFFYPVRYGPDIPVSGEGPGDASNGGNFNLRLTIFPDILTLFHEKMTLLFGETLILIPDRPESALWLPGIVGLLHSYSGESAGTGAGGCVGEKGRE